jgi:hypothetical protein
MKVSASTPAVIFRVSYGGGRVGITVTLYAPIPEVLVSNLGRDIGYPHCSAHVLPQSLQENVTILFKLPITVAGRAV